MNGLHPQHEDELLNGSVILPDLVSSRGYVTVTEDQRELLKDADCPAWAVREPTAFPGLFIPLYHVRTGERTGFQFKPAVPQCAPGKEKPSKYITRRGMGNRLDCNPLIRHLVADPAYALWITEGPKKADALASQGMAAVTLTGVWNWRRTEGALGDWEDIPLRGRSVVVCFDSDAADNPQVRHAMVRLVGFLRSRGAAKVKYLVVLPKVGDTPVKGVDDFFAAGGTVPDLVAVATDRAPGSDVPRDAAFTDAFLTDTVCDESLGGRFLFARGLGWMRYDGSRWLETDESVIVEEIRQWVKAHWEGVLEEHKTDQSREVQERMRGWRQVLNSGRLRALASLAKGLLHAEAAEFDRHPDLLNCPNGVVDLRTGELLDPDPEYRFTKVTGVEYDADADDPDFRTALGALPDDVQGWYRTRIGQAFTGYMTSDDLFIVQQGSGENGKSTLSVPLERAAGDYQVLVSHRVILGNADQHPTEKMDLRGARFALMEETPEARQLNVQQLKEVVGTPQITARRIRQDSVTFDATHSLFVNTNFRPAVAESDHATWRRLALVKFPFTFRKTPEEVTGPYDKLGDPSIRQRCQTQPGPPRAALAWAVRGAIEWYAAGKVFPPPPDRVREDTDAWRREGDLILAFADERLEFGPGYTSRTEDLFAEFGQWLLPTGHRPWTQRTFVGRFGEHDRIKGNRVVLTRHRTKGRYWEGVRIAPKHDEGPADPSSNPFAQTPG